MARKIKRYLGIDWGEKRIGLALGDNEIKVASPFKTAGNIDKVLQIIKEEKVDIIVVGKPFKMQNKQFKVQKEFLSFLKLLKRKVRIPINTIDERLSSKLAATLSGNRKTKIPQDTVAAMIILQTYLDRLNTK